MKAGAAVAITVEITAGFRLRLNDEFVRLAQIVGPRRVHVQDRHHGHWRGNVKLDVISKPDKHRRLRVVRSLKSWPDYILPHKKRGAKLKMRGIGISDWRPLTRYEPLGYLT